jgi:hypothetical protein
MALTCRTDACIQGRKPCPTPGHCNAYWPLQITMEDDREDRVVQRYLDTPTADEVLGWVEYAVALIFLLSICGLAVWAIVKWWPVLAALV